MLCLLTCLCSQISVGHGYPCQGQQGGRVQTAAPPTSGRHLQSARLQDEAVPQGRVQRLALTCTESIEQPHSRLFGGVISEFSVVAVATKLFFKATEQFFNFQ